jgi:hypothetical protein
MNQTAIAVLIVALLSGCSSSPGQTVGGGGSGGQPSAGSGGAGGSGGGGVPVVPADASPGPSGAGGATPDPGGGGGAAGTGLDAGTPRGEPDGAASGDAPSAPPAGMTPLFDGKSLEGWDGNPAIWSVNPADMAIRGKTGNGGQLINTKQSYLAFRLLVTAKMLITTTNHMGICFWGGPATPGRWQYNGCLDFMPPWGGLWDYKSNGSLLAPQADQSIQAQWMQIEILALASGQVLGAINGMQTTDKTIAGRARMSPIGLQAHAGASDQEYKDISIEVDPPVHTLITVKH